VGRSYRRLYFPSFEQNSEIVFVRAWLNQCSAFAENAPENEGDSEQFNGREGETATFLSRCLFILTLRVAVSPHVISSVRRLHLIKV
jgi:hypothetical protein